MGFSGKQNVLFACAQKIPQACSQAAIQEIRRNTVQNSHTSHLVVDDFVDSKLTIVHIPVAYQV